MTMCDDDLNAIRDDDALIDAIAGGDTEAMRALSGVEPAELVETLAALAGTTVVTHLLPAGRSGLTDCCHRPVTDPAIKCVTHDQDAVTCQGMRP